MAGGYECRRRSAEMRRFYWRGTLLALLEPNRDINIYMTALLPACIQIEGWHFRWY
jgi:hypothetical protein